MRCVIGLVGAKGSGKGTFVSLLTQRLRGVSIEALRFSDVLYDTCALWDKPATRENLQRMAVAMEREWVGALAHAVKTRVMKSPADVVVIDGVRWEPDVAVLRSFPVNILVYVQTDARLRFERLKARNEKVGEGDTTWEQFLEEERAPNEVRIVEIGADADFTITNNAGPDAFVRQVDEFVLKYRTALT